MPYMLLIVEPPGQRAERGLEGGKQAYAQMQAFAAATSVDLSMAEALMPRAFGTAARENWAPLVAVAQALGAGMVGHQEQDVGAAWHTATLQSAFSNDGSAPTRNSRSQAPNHKQISKPNPEDIQTSRDRHRILRL